MLSYIHPIEAIIEKRRWHKAHPVGAPGREWYGPYPKAHETKKRSKKNASMGLESNSEVVRQDRRRKVSAHSED